MDKHTIAILDYEDGSVVILKVSAEVWEEFQKNPTDFLESQGYPEKYTQWMEITGDIFFRKLYTPKDV